MSKLGKLKKIRRFEKSPHRRVRGQVGAATAEYAAVSAAGLGFAAVLIKFLTSDVGQQILKAIFQVALRFIGINL